jgi:hypothetical protein
MVQCLWFSFAYIESVHGCWVHAYFEEIPNFGQVRPNCGEEQLARKATHSRENRMLRRKSCKECKKEKLTMLGLGF